MDLSFGVFCCSSKKTIWNERKRWFQLERNSSEVLTQVEEQVGTRLRRRLSSKDRVEECALFILPMILYWLSVLSPPEGHRRALRQSLTTSLRQGGKPIVCRQVCCQCTRYGGLGMLDLNSHWLAGIPIDLSRECRDETQGRDGFSWIWV